MCEVKERRDMEIEGNEVSLILQYLAPWVEKNDDEESIGSWETTMATKMMLKLLEVWLTPESRELIGKMLLYYHPLDRAAMSYALVLKMMTGREMVFKSAVANQHFKVAWNMMMEDMPVLFFADHLKCMLDKYGPKSFIDETNSKNYQGNHGSPEEGQESGRPTVYTGGKYGTVGDCLQALQPQEDHPREGSVDQTAGTRLGERESAAHQGLREHPQELGCGSCEQRVGS